MKKLSLLALLGVSILTLSGCGSSSEKSEESSLPESPETVQVDACTKYFDLLECTMKQAEVPSEAQSGEDTLALYLTTLKADINSLPEDQQQTYCSEQWDTLLPYASTYAELGCPMD